jgi:hypothetical protein
MKGKRMYALRTDKEGVMIKRAKENEEGSEASFYIEKIEWARLMN